MPHFSNRHIKYKNRINNYHSRSNHSKNNHNNQVANTNSDTNMLNCPYCNRKYKTQEKFDNHIVSKHKDYEVKRFPTREERQEQERKQKEQQDKWKRERQARQLETYKKSYSKYNTIRPTNMIKLLNSLMNYLKVVEYVANEVNEQRIIADIGAYISWNHKSEPSINIKHIETVHKLMPQSIERSKTLFNTFEQQMQRENKVLYLDGKLTSLYKLAITHMNFCKKSLERNFIYQAINSPEQVNKLLEQLERFLNLEPPSKTNNHNPTMIIDLMWHGTMCDLKNYTSICNELNNGYIMPHCLEENSEVYDEIRHRKFLEAWNARYKEAPMQYEDLTDDPLTSIDECVGVIKETIEQWEEKERLRKEEENARLQERLRKENEAFIAARETREKEWEEKVKAQDEAYAKNYPMNAYQIERNKATQPQRIAAGPPLVYNNWGGCSC